MSSSKIRSKQQYNDINKNKLNVSKMFDFTKSLLDLDSGPSKYDVPMYRIIQNTSRFKEYIQKNNKVEVDHLAQLIASNDDITKLQTVMDYGEISMLPQISEIFPNEIQPKPQQEIKKVDDPRYRFKTQKYERIPMEFKHILMRECKKKDSYIRKGQQTKQQNHARSYELPKQLVQLKQNLFKRKSPFNSKSLLSTDIKLSSQNKPKKINLIIKDTHNLMQQQNLHLRIKKEAKNQERSYDNINKDYEDVIKNQFPPVILSKMIRKMNNEEQKLIKEIQQDMMKEEQKNIYKKFNRMMQNEQLNHRAHVKHLSEYKSIKKKY